MQRTHYTNGRHTLRPDSKSPATSSPRSHRRAGVSSVLRALSPGTAELVSQWLALDKNPHSRAVVQEMGKAGDESGLVGILSKRLEFGTAGLRGQMGPGFNAMNDVVIQQTTQGLCRYLLKHSPQTVLKHGVVIGHDARHNSARFAAVAAAVFISQGVHVHLFSTHVPTPYVAAAVTELGAACGVMVTASHNPKADNGYKVYAGNGCQIIPPADEDIAASILEHSALWDLGGPGHAQSPQDLGGHPLVSDPLQRVQQAYWGRLTAGLRFNSPEVNAGAGRVTYTPLHGVGLVPLLDAFKVVGLPAPHVVPTQAEPDPEFPTVILPNPEEGQGTWRLAFEEGERQGSQVVIANDPDADRLAVAERSSPSGGSFVPFTGNEIGALLAWWMWTNHRRLRPEVPPSKCAMLASTVSSRWLGFMAAKEGFRFEQTLTGFKWLGNRAQELEAQGYTVLFAFEEAIGFMPGPMYRDKDGISSAAALCEMAAHVYSHQGGTLRGTLSQLYDKYGSSAYRSGYFIADVPSKSRAVFDRLRAEGYPKVVAGHHVTAVRDLGVGLDTAQHDGKAILPWRAGDMMITLTLGQAATEITIRASGTEPKLKYYLEVVGNDSKQASSTADALVKAVDSEVIRVDEAGLKRPNTS